MPTDHIAHVERSRTKLLRAIGTSDNLTFVRTPGNIGDQLIHAGARQLLSGMTYREVSLAEVRHCQGHTALLGGGGAWCGPYQSLPEYLPLIEERFKQVVVLPSSFDIKIDRVRQILSNTRAVVFAREKVSYQQIRTLCDAEVAHDCAFFFDFGPHRRTGKGVLMAFRTDQESAFKSVPRENLDISSTCSNLDDWLEIVADHEIIQTDRAHVTIAGALLGKRVEYLASNYHKIPAIVDYALRDFPVSRLPDDWIEKACDGSSTLTDSEHLRILADKVDALIPAGSVFLLVDNDLIGAIPLVDRIRVPFLEREGSYWGPPPDDESAIGEFERMRRKGAGFIVFAWPAFWWLDHYQGFHRHLRSNFQCLFESDSVVIFDVRTHHAA